MVEINLPEYVCTIHSDNPIYDYLHSTYRKFPVVRVSITEEKDTDGDLLHYIGHKEFDSDYVFVGFFGFIEVYKIINQEEEE